MIAASLAAPAFAQDVPGGAEEPRPAETAPGQADQPQPAGAATQPGGQMSPQALETLNRLHRMNQLEIEAGQLAQQNSESARVRRYGDTLVRDHRQADREVQELARARDVQLTAPLPRDGLEQERMQEQQATLDRLRSLRGAEFDREFLPVMVAEHEAAIQMLQQARAEVQDGELRALFARLLPVLQQHRDLAQRLRDEVERQTGVGQRSPAEPEPRGSAAPPHQPAP